MSESPDPQLVLRLRIAFRGDPEGKPDDFAELVAALLGFRTFGGAMDRRLGDRLGITVDDVHRMADGILAPTPGFRRDAVKKLRGISAELGIKED